MDVFKHKIQKDKYIIVKNNIGYYEVLNKPTEKELNDFYSKELYQDPENHTSSYSIQYTKEELQYIENKSKKIYDIVKDVSNKTILDVGCGEGYVSRFFLNLNYKIKSLDYSKFAVGKHNPEVSEYFIEGDVFQNLNVIIENKEKYGVIILNNVIEHVLNPQDILEKIKKILDNNGILIITAPNDFSNLQSHLINKNYISELNWLAPPVHLSYFTLKSLISLVKNCDYSVYNYYAEYPIDFDLLVENTNYVNNKTVGNFSHLKRIRVDNFLCSQSITKTNEYYKKLADLSCGRDIVIFLKHS